MQRIFVNIKTWANISILEEEKNNDTHLWITTLFGYLWFILDIQNVRVISWNFKKSYLPYIKVHKQQEKSQCVWCIFNDVCIIQKIIIYNVINLIYSVQKCQIIWINQSK